MMTKPTATSEITIPAPIDAVFKVLADATSYPDWLVGAQHIRAVDDEWPAPGSAFHHSVGVGPLLLHDHTDVVEFEAPYRLVLEAHIGPFGSAVVAFELEPEGTGTHLTLDERPSTGPIRFGWNTIGRPLLQLALWGRNELSLDQLADLVDATPRAGDDPV